MGGGGSFTPTIRVAEKGIGMLKGDHTTFSGSSNAGILSFSHAFEVKGGGERETQKLYPLARVCGGGGGLQRNVPTGDFSILCTPLSQ